MGQCSLGCEFQSLKLVQGRCLIFWLKYDRRDVFARSRIQMSGQNCRMELEVATNYSVPATVSHQHRGNDEATDRQTQLPSNFELELIEVGGRNIETDTFDRD